MGYKKRHLDAFLRQSCTFTATFYPVVWDILDWSHQRPSHYINGRNRKSLWLWLLFFSPFFQAESCPVCLSVNIFILEFTKFLFCCFQGFLSKNRKLFHSAPLSLMHLSSSFSASAKSLQRKHPLYFFSSPLSFLHFISPLLLLPSHSWFFSLHFFSLFFHAAVLIPPIVSLLPFCLYRHLLSPSLPSLLHLGTRLLCFSFFWSLFLISFSLASFHFPFLLCCFLWLLFTCLFPLISLPYSLLLLLLLPSCFHCDLFLHLFCFLFPLYFLILPCFLISYPFLLVSLCWSPPFCVKVLFFSPVIFHLLHFPLAYSPPLLSFPSSSVFSSSCFFIPLLFLCGVLPLLSFSLSLSMCGGD